MCSACSSVNSKLISPHFQQFFLLPASLHDPVSSVRVRSQEKMSEFVGGNISQKACQVNIPVSAQFCRLIKKYVAVTACPFGGQKGHAEDLVHRAAGAVNDTKRQVRWPIEVDTVCAVCGAGSCGNRQCPGLPGLGRTRSSTRSPLVRRGRKFSQPPPLPGSRPRTTHRRRYRQKQ